MSSALVMPPLSSSLSLNMPRCLPISSMALLASVTLKVYLARRIALAVEHGLVLHAALGHLLEAAENPILVQLDPFSAAPLELRARLPGP